MANSNVFETLRLGIKFDAKRFEKELEVFKGTASHHSAQHGKPAL